MGSLCTKQGDFECHGFDPDPKMGGGLTVPTAQNTTKSTVKSGVFQIFGSRKSPISQQNLDKWIASDTSSSCDTPEVKSDRSEIAKEDSLEEIKVAQSIILNKSTDTRRNPTFDEYSNDENSDDQDQKIFQGVFKRQTQEQRNMVSRKKASFKHKQHIQRMYGFKWNNHKE